MWCGACVMLTLFGIVENKSLQSIVQWEVRDTSYEFEVAMPVDAKRVLVYETEKALHTSSLVDLERIDEVKGQLEQLCINLGLPPIRVDIVVIDRGRGTADVVVVFNAPKAPTRRRILHRPTFEMLEPRLLPALNLG